MATHTAGPWKAGWNGGITGPLAAATHKWDRKYPITRHMYDDVNYPVAFVTMEDPDHEANARLIAAAPDLLAALKSIIEGVDEFWMEEHPGAIDAAQQAIDDAEGRAALQSASGSPEDAK